VARRSSLRYNPGKKMANLHLVTESVSTLSFDVKRASVANAILVGAALFSFAIIWLIFHTSVPVVLAELGLSATLVGLIMSWDNYSSLFLQPVAGALSEQAGTRIGRWKPWVLLGAPRGGRLCRCHSRDAVRGRHRVGHPGDERRHGLAVRRSPTSAPLGDLSSPEQRGTSNRVLRLMGGLGLTSEWI